MTMLRKTATWLLAVVGFCILGLVVIRYQDPNGEELNFERSVIRGGRLTDHAAISCSDCNLLVITIDTLRADSLGSYGYPRPVSPNIDRFAEKSIVLNRVYAPVPLTVPSHATLFTGRQPFSHRVQDQFGTLANEETTLAELLKQQHYATGAITGAAVLAPRTGLHQGFDTFDFPQPDLGGATRITEITRTADEVSNRALTWLNEHKREKFFLWLHYWDPHTPYSPPTDHDEFTSAFDVLHHAAFFGHSIHAQRALYDGEVRFVDSELQRILEFLQGTRLLDKTVVLLTSDHGENFGWNDHGDSLYEHELHVPAVLYNQGVSGASDKLLSSAQLMPTLLQILDIESDDSLLPPVFESEDAPVLFFSSDKLRPCHPARNRVFSSP